MNDEYLKALERVENIARIIFQVTDKVSHSSSRNRIECPHGNIPTYPAHAWWCDDCWLELREALEDFETVKLNPVESL